MYHTNTKVVQRSIIDSFSKEDGEIRILFATIAFGMGIDVKGVHSVIILGHPTDLDDLKHRNLYHYIFKVLEM